METIIAWDLIDTSSDSEDDDGFYSCDGDIENEDYLTTLLRLYYLKEFVISESSS